MSQVKLTLRPPPNVDFVHGYPGIPPGAADRPSAAIKGAIEVRAPPAGTKAKWVRIELRKVETLPAGGPANTFYDFVGPSPVNLWTAGEDYAMLMTQDFPFSIRVPESIPPSLALDSKAGVRYELVASVCSKGKKSFFFRRAKSVVVSSITPITIDKHELHSTWPVYAQHDSRSRTQDGVTLTVERNQTCYGPGDKMVLQAILRSDSTSTVILRGFEIVLRETTRFTGHPPKKGFSAPASEARVAIIAENKLAVNATLYGGTKHSAELNLDLSPRHTTTSLGSARHIDIDYAIIVKAILGTGKQVSVELPVVISNWQRRVSVEAVRRIGPAPSLSLTSTNTAPLAQKSAQSTPSPPPPAATVPAKTSTNDFGHKTNKDVSTSLPSPTARPTHRPNNSTGSATMPKKRLTIHNSEPISPIEEGKPAKKKHWPTAEEEKERMFAQAKAKVEKVQAAAAAAAAKASATSSSSTPVPGPGPAIVTITTTPVTRKISGSASVASTTTKWPTAEEEKQRFFNEAQAAVSKVQQGTVVSNEGQGISNAASLYASGINARSKPPGSSSSNKTGGSSSNSKPAYPTAEQEKAALRLYDQAREAVSRTQNAIDGETAGSSSSSPRRSDMNSYPSPPPHKNGYSFSPPPFQAPMDALTQLSEKERMRMAYQERDAGRISDYTAPPPSFLPQPIVGAQILTEKEMLRRKFEAEEAAAARVPSYSPSYSAAPSPPSPPARLRSPTVPHSPGRILTAIEEKAHLRAKYAEVDRLQSNGNGNGPPPLMPRPPKDYIRKTEEEEARVSKYVDQPSPLRAWSTYENGVGPPPPLPPKRE